MIWSSEVEYRGRAKDIDYYGVTFDHLLDDVDGDDPEVLQINIIETEYDSAAYTNKYSQLQIDPREYILSECLPSIDAARHGEVQRITDGLMKMLMPDVWRNETGRVDSPI